MTSSLQLPSPVWRFVPAGLDAGDLPAIERLFEQLAARDLATAADLERFLLDESELGARIGAELARRYIRMTRHTADADARQAYLDYEQRVMPRVKVLSDRLDKHFLASPALGDLDPERYGVLLRRRRTQSEIFREANTSLQQEEAELQTRQQALMGGIQVPFDGRPHTLQQMAPYYESQDRDVRERAFRAALEARARTWPELEDIYDRLVDLRTRIARNAGHDRYTTFRFLELGRFDYSPDDCRSFHAAVEQAVVPALRELNAERRRRLGIDTLRPWDLEVDTSGRPPLRPFATEPELIGICRKVFARVDPRFDAEFGVLVDRDLLDLMSRPGKAPGGYQYTLEDERVPFVFANSVGVHGDVQTLLHEGGHSFHALLSRHHDLAAYRDSPIEFAETASMSMELLGLENLTASYDAEAAARAAGKHLEGVLRVLPWIASIDALQHWVYDNPGHDRNARRREWLRIRARFAPDLDWSGLDDALAMQWIGQTHLFNHAFYYIEYGIAQIASLQVWRNYRRDPQRAVADYRAALALGGSRPLPDLFARAGVRFDLSPALLQELVGDVMTQLRR